MAQHSVGEFVDVLWIQRQAPASNKRPQRSGRPKHLLRGWFIHRVLSPAADPRSQYCQNQAIPATASAASAHGLFIILAIGESVVAIGYGAAEQPISAPLLFAAILGVATAVCLWWLYFDVVSLAAEHRLVEARGQARVDLAVEAYTYGHFPIVAGIVLAALGVEGALAHAGESKPLGVFYALPLFGGCALYLAGHLLFKRRTHGVLSLPRLLATCVLVAVLPAAVVLPPLVGLAGVVVILAALMVVETTRYPQARHSLRGT